MRELLALAERVEAYDPRLSPDNRADEMPLDLAIAKALGKADADSFVMRGSVTGYGFGDGRGGYGNCIVEQYTRSLDAAMGLVPAGWGWRVSDGGTAGCWTRGPAPKPVVIDGFAFPGVLAQASGNAATPALALCAAALRARAATGEVGNG